MSEDQTEPTNVPMTDWAQCLANKLPSILPRLACLAVGMALLRVWRSWAFMLTASVDGAALLGLGLRDLFSLGTLLGTALCLAILKVARSISVGPAVPISIACILAGSVALLLANVHELPLAATGCAVAVLVIGGAFALLQSAWVEWLGLYATPLLTLLSYSVAWLFHAVLWVPLRALSAEAFSFGTIVTLLPTLSVAMMVLDRMTTSASPSSLSPGPLGACEAQHLRGSIPTFAWTWAFTLAYCIGTSYTGQGSSASGPMLGELLSVLVLVAAFCVLGNNFDYTTTCRFSMVVLALGCAAAALDDQNPVLVQACFSASNVTIMSLAATFICASAALRRTSAAWSYSTLMLGWYVIALGTRLTMRLVNFAPTAQSALFAAVAAGTLLLLGVTTWRKADPLSQWREVCLTSPNDRLVLRCQEIAATGGLGERETGVMVLLVQGKTYTEISEQLFIAPGTVRAHASHVYEKLGVHSRQELAQKVKDAT